MFQELAGMLTKFFFIFHFMFLNRFTYLFLECPIAVLHSIYNSFFNFF